jgi:hypothetical protein
MGTTPSAPAKEASRNFLWVAATPPNLGGTRSPATPSYFTRAETRQFTGFGEYVAAPTNGWELNAVVNAQAIEPALFLETSEAESTRCGGLLTVMRCEYKVDAPTLSNGDGADKVKGVESFDDRLHSNRGKRSFVGSKFLQ